MFNTCTLAEASPPPWIIAFQVEKCCDPTLNRNPKESESTIFTVVILARKDRYTSNYQANESKIQYAMYFDEKIESMLVANKY